MNKRHIFSLLRRNCSTYQFWPEFYWLFMGYRYSNNVIEFGTYWRSITPIITMKLKISVLQSSQMKIELWIFLKFYFAVFHNIYYVYAGFKYHFNGYSGWRAIIYGSCRTQIFYSFYRSWRNTNLRNRYHCKQNVIKQNTSLVSFAIATTRTNSITWFL